MSSDVLDVVAVQGRDVHAPDYAGAWARALRERITELVTRTTDTDGRGTRWPRAVADVLEVLARHADALGECWPSQETIARATAYSTRHVARALADARRLGLLVASVPSFAARVAAGATTRYGLPWWAGVVRGGIRVLARAQGSLRLRTPAQSAAVARALEAVAPDALLSRVLGTLPPAMRAGLVRAGVVDAYVSQLAPQVERAAHRAAHRAAVQETQRPVKTLQQNTGAEHAPAQAGKDDRAPSARAEVTPSLRADIAAVAARVAALARPKV